MTWTAIPQIVELPNEQVINCDTRDFACNSFEVPDTKEFLSDKDKNMTKLRNLLLLIKKGKLKTDKYFIKKEEILNWLSSIKEKTGGDKEWRIWSANLKDCQGWDLKYLRFYKAYDNVYIACNSYWIPIEWKEVLNNLVFHDY